LKIEKENALDIDKWKILKGICEQSSKTITALYLNTNPAPRKTNKAVRQRLIFFMMERVERVECVERMEREGEGGRGGTGGASNIYEGGEAGVDLVV